MGSHVYRAADAETGQAALDAFAQGPWGRQVSRYRPELAPQLGPRDSILRLSRRRPADHVHNEGDRGAPLKSNRDAQWQTGAIAKTQRPWRNGRQGRDASTQTTDRGEWHENARAFRGIFLLLAKASGWASSGEAESLLCAGN